MADITWPTTGGRDFDPEAFDEAIEFNVELAVARSGKVTTLALPGGRFRCVMRFRDEAVSRLQQRRQLHAFFASLRGGADRLLLWNLHTPQPLGNMRGTVTLAATLAAGASSASIVCGSAYPNLLQGAGFEYATAGVANSWAVYAAGTTGTVTPTLNTGNVATYGALAQAISASGMGSTGGDQIGVRYGTDVPVTSGAAYSLAADTRESGMTVRLYVGWYSAANALIGTTEQAFSTSGATWTRRQVTGAAPPTAAYAKVYVWGEAATGGPVAANIQIDNAQFEQAATPTAFSAPGKLLRGDFIGIGGQRVMLTADLAGDDGTTQTAYFQPAHRAGAASGAAVTLVRPTTRYVFTSPVVQMAATGTVLPGFAVEMVEE